MNYDELQDAVVRSVPEFLSWPVFVTNYYCGIRSRDLMHRSQTLLSLDHCERWLKESKRFGVWRPSSRAAEETMLVSLSQKH